MTCQQPPGTLNPVAVPKPAIFPHANMLQNNYLRIIPTPHPPPSAKPRCSRTRQLRRRAPSNR